MTRAVQTFLFVIVTFVVASNAFNELLAIGDVAAVVANNYSVTFPLEYVKTQIAKYPTDHVVFGMGTTNYPTRHGEMIPYGTVSNMTYYWADPHGYANSTVIDIEGSDSPFREHSVPIRVPFFGVGIVDPKEVKEFTYKNYGNDKMEMHEWVTNTLKGLDIKYAGAIIEGDFGNVVYSVGDYIDTSKGPANIVHTLDSGSWHMAGVFTTDMKVYPYICDFNQTIHLHGWLKPPIMLGGHVRYAYPWNVSVKVYPIEKQNVKILDTPISL